MHVSFIPRHCKKSHGSSVLSCWQVGSGTLLHRDGIAYTSVLPNEVQAVHVLRLLAWSGCHTMNRHDLHAVKQPILWSKYLIYPHLRPQLTALATGNWHLPTTSPQKSLSGLCPLRNGPVPSCPVSFHCSLPTARRYFLI